MKNFPLLSDEYAAFCQEKDKCRKCDVYEHYEQVIQSEGNGRDPTFMFVGEAGGHDEACQIRPFVGRAGQRLRKELRKWPATFSKKTTMLSNILSCRPFQNGFPAGGYVEEGEKEVSCDDLGRYCMRLWLEREIQLLRPKVIVALGAIPLRYLFGIKEEKPRIGLHRGEWTFLPQYQAMGFATYHPSYVLRCTNDPKKSYGAKLFEQDIEKIATTWKKSVASEPRMHVSEAELKKQVTFAKLREKLAPAGILCQGVEDD